MTRYLLRRLTWAVPVVFGVLIISFLLTRVVPGDPILALIGEFPAPAEYIAEKRIQFGLDSPIPVQLGLYLANLLQGDLGYSFVNQQPVFDLIIYRAGNTLMLAIPALIIASFMGVILASLAAHRPGGPFDVVLTSIILIVDSIPVFWLGQILIIIFAVKLQILPSYGMITLRNPPTGFGAVLDFLVHWILPGMAVAIVSMGLISRVARASLAETSTQDFVTTAQALGMSDRAVLWKHILPNAMIPVISVIGYNFGHAITGTIMTEAVFAWPGLGGLFVSSINSRDYPVLQGIFMLTAITVVFANLVTDLIYGLVDPRVRYGR